METFSLDGWPMFIGSLAIYLVLLAVADTSKTMPRIPFLLRIVGSVAALIATGFVSVTTGAIPWLFITLAIGLFVSVFMVLWSAHRAQDIGWSKWTCLLYLVPLVGLIFWLALIFWPGQGEDRRSTMATA